jgi:hypothetical protein
MFLFGIPYYYESESCQFANGVILIVYQDIATTNLAGIFKGLLLLQFV